MGKAGRRFERESGHRRREAVVFLRIHSRLAVCFLLSILNFDVVVILTRKGDFALCSLEVVAFI